MYFPTRRCPLSKSRGGLDDHCESRWPLTPLSGYSTSLEALKSLLFTTGHCHDFAHLELQGAWEHFSSISTYPQGVVLLAR